jgi:hypothetical protein
MPDPDDNEKTTPVALLRVRIDLPDTVDLESVDQAERRVVIAVASGATPYRAALALSRILEHRRRVIADRDIVDRMDAIDAANKQRAAAAARKAQP